MKLRTKFQDKDFELGEVTDADIVTQPNGHIEVYARIKRGIKVIRSYNSLAEFNSKWEDAPEEPKKFWYIEGDGDIHSIRTELCEELEIHTMKRIGNHFETKEEAEKAVERLRAWQRLKDKGFEFDGIDFSHRAVKFKVPSSFFNGEENIFVSGQSDADLRFLFGGEE